MISHIPNHAARALGDMLGQDRERPRMAALIRARSAATQTKEDLFFDLLLTNNIRDAGGALLDRWGAFVREGRGGLDDEDYRKFIRARISANLSGGSVGEIVEIVSTLVAPAVVVNVELYPAAFSLIIEGAEALGDDLRERIREFVRDIKPGGVGFDIIEALPNSFTLDAGPGYDVGELARLF